MAKSIFPFSTLSALVILGGFINLATFKASARNGESGLNGGPMIAGLAHAGGPCSLESVVSRDGWAQVRRQPNLDGTPLWRLTNGSTLAWCGAGTRDADGRLWHFVRFVTGDESWQHSGWVSAGLLTQVDESEGASAAALKPAPPPSSPSSSAVTPSMRPKSERAEDQKGGIGTGFFISPEGYIITNAHVVKGCSVVQAASGMNFRRDARVVATDTANDLALLKIETKQAAYSQLRSGVKTGEKSPRSGFPCMGCLRRPGISPWAMFRRSRASATTPATFRSPHPSSRETVAAPSSTRTAMSSAWSSRS